MCMLNGIRGTLGTVLHSLVFNNVIIQPSKIYHDTITPINASAWYINNLDGNKRPSGPKEDIITWIISTISIVYFKYTFSISG